MSAFAKAPARSTGKLVIQFGPVSVPVDVFNGIEDEANKVKRSMRSPQGNPVAFKKMDPETGEMLAQADISYVVASEDGTEVGLSDEEMEAAMKLENGTSELVGFYDMARADAFVTRSLMQIRPQTMKTGKKVSRPFDRAYALLMGAMKAQGTFALIKYVMRGKLHLAGIFPNGEMREFYWANELRAEREMPEVELTAKELELASALVSTMTSDAPPALENTAVMAVRDYVESKAAGAAPKEAPAAAPALESFDLEALLSASLEAVGK